MIFAVDLGGKYLRAAAVDSDGRIVSRLKLRTPQTDDPQDIVRVVAGALIEGQREADRIGAVDSRAGTGRLKTQAKLSGLRTSHALMDSISHLRWPVTCTSGDYRK